MNKDEVKHLKNLTTKLIRLNKEKTSLILSKLLHMEFINLQSGIKVFEEIGGDCNILKRTYHNLLTDEELLNEDLLSKMLINADVDKKQAEDIESEIRRTIEAPRHFGSLTKMLETDVYAILDPEKKQTFREKTRYDKKGNPDPITTLVLEVCLKKLIIYDSPINEEPRQFKATFDVNGGVRPLIVGPAFREDIINSLKDNNYIASKRYGEDIISASLNLFAQEGKAEMKTDIETPGFFYNNDTKSIINAKYEVKMPDNDEIKEGFKVLEEFAGYFKGVESKVATIFKYGLVSPFAFAKKQMGAKWIPYYFLYGQPGSGKSRLGQMVLYMWNEPDDGENNIGGGSFDTEARIGGALSKFTFPIVVDEPAGVFAKDGLIEIIKNAVLKTVLRSRYRAGHLGTIPSYSPVIFTSNVSSPQDIALGRRIETLSFTHDEMKTPEQMNEFDNVFQMDSPQRSKLNALKAITQAVSLEVMADPKLLEMDWKELADTLLIRLHMDIGEDIPLWLQGWVKTETIEDIEYEQRESIRILILNNLNREIKRIPLVDDEFRPVTLESTPKVRGHKGFHSRVWYVVNEGLVPWIVPFHDSRKNEDYVCLTIGFKKVLQDELKICQTLKGISQLMNWNYQSVRIQKPEKVIKIEFGKFVEMIYPRCSEDDQSS